MEGGGSHGHAVVADDTGAVLGVGKISDSTNWEDVGIEAAGGAIKACVRWALDAAEIHAETIDASVFSLAGVDFPVDSDLLGGIPMAIGLSRSVRIMNDAYSALRAGSDQPFGVVASAGTGSIVAGRNPEGEEFRTLGLGPMFGDSGSASEVSEAGVSAVAAAFTRRGPETALSTSMCRAAGAQSVTEFLEGVARGRFDQAAYASLVVDAAEDGDGAAVGILSDAGRSLGGTVAHVIRMLRMEHSAFDLVLAGGLFRNASAFVAGPLSEVVRPVAPRVTLALLKEPPVIGAALLALELAGTQPSPETRHELSEGVLPAIGEPQHL